MIATSSIHGPTPHLTPMVAADSRCFISLQMQVVYRRDEHLGQELLAMQASRPDGQTLLLPKPILPAEQAPV